MSLTVGASSPLLSCSNKHGHVSLKNPEQGIQLYSGNSCPRSRQGSGERNRYGGKGSQSNSPLVLDPWISSVPRPALGHSPLGPNPAPAVCHETGHRSLAQASVSVVSRLMASGVLRSCFHVGVLRCGCASESQGAWSEAHQSLRRTADPVYWLLFMPEETEAWGGLEESHC